MATKLSEHARQASEHPREAWAALDGAAEFKSQAQTRIRRFERRYSMTSEEMRRRLASGEIEENSDICSWLMALQALEMGKPHAATHP